MRLIIRRLLRVFVALCLGLGATSCGGSMRHTEKQIVVTIPPLGGLVEQIVGDDYDVVVLLPSGSAPESYSPTPRQVASLSAAEHVFVVGTLNFEKEIIKHLDSESNIVNASEGIELMAGSCGHNGSHGCECEEHDHHKAHHHHDAGVDPHVWLSPRNLEQMVDNIARAIVVANPDSVKYVANYEKLKHALQVRRVAYGEALAGCAREVLVYHPALGYFAAEYGMEQISLEHEGKNPTPSSLADVIERVNGGDIEVMLYQQEYPLEVVKPIADILNVKLLQINPLHYNIISELDRIVEILVDNYE